jgi:hypothetical protein
MSEEPTGPTGSNSSLPEEQAGGTGSMYELGPTGPPPPPPTITLADILSSTEAISQKEAADKAALEGIGHIGIETLRTKLIQWAVAGFPSAYAIHEVTITPPALCSDGISRVLGEYIEFCSGKTIHEHVAVLQAVLPDITVSFSYTGFSIQVVVTRPMA